MIENNSVSEATKKLVRLGLIAKGVLYLLIGILAIIPIIGMTGEGGGNSNQKQVLQWLLEKPLGTVMVALIAIGLLFYAFYRLMLAFSHSSRFSGTKGAVTRAGHIISGLLYGAFAIYAGSLVLKAINGGGGGSSSGNTQTQVIQDLMDSTWGRILLVAIGLALIGRSIYYIYQAYSGKYRKKIQGYGIKEHYEEYLIRAAKIGFLARGVVFSIIGYFFIKAVLSHDPSTASQGTGEAFDFIQGTAGTIVLLVIAVGFVCYGIFMFMQAKYRSIESLI